MASSRSAPLGCHEFVFCQDSLGLCGVNEAIKEKLLGSELRSTIDRRFGRLAIGNRWSKDLETSAFASWDGCGWAHSGTWVTCSRPRAGLLSMSWRETCAVSEPSRLTQLAVRGVPPRSRPPALWSRRVRCGREDTGGRPVWRARRGGEACASARSRQHPLLSNRELLTANRTLVG